MHKYIRTISVLLLAAAIVMASHAGRFAGASGWVPISVGRDAFSRDTEFELHPAESQHKTRNDSPQRAEAPKISGTVYRPSSSR